MVGLPATLFSWSKFNFEDVESGINLFGDFSKKYFKNFISMSSNTDIKKKTCQENYNTRLVYLLKTTIYQLNQNVLHFWWFIKIVFFVRIKLNFIVTITRLKRLINQLWSGLINVRSSLPLRFHFYIINIINKNKINKLSNKIT